LEAGVPSWGVEVIIGKSGVEQCRVKFLLRIGLVQHPQRWIYFKKKKKKKKGEKEEEGKDEGGEVQVHVGRERERGSLPVEFSYMRKAMK